MALVDQIYPPDETPGASEIGAVHFMDAALGGFASAVQPVVSGGVQYLDNLARDRHPAGLGFAELPFQDQTEVVKQVEGTPFFKTVHTLTVWGLFAMPRYGGNASGAGWKQIGFDARHAWDPPFGFYDAEGQADSTDGG